MNDPEKIKIFLNTNITMSRGKAAAHAVHAALTAAGVHPGLPVVVLGAKPRHILEMRTHIHDEGRTELDPGTLTAGTDWAPAAAAGLPTVDELAKVLYEAVPYRETTWEQALATRTIGAEHDVHTARAQAEAVLAHLRQPTPEAQPAALDFAPPALAHDAAQPREGSLIRDRHRHWWRVNRTRVINLTPHDQTRPNEYGWAHWGALNSLDYGPFQLMRDGKRDWVSDYRPPAGVSYW